MTPLSRHRATARYRGIHHELTQAEYGELITGPCAYCGRDSLGGIDRLDSTKGYTLSNCVPSCRRCNARKSCFERLGVGAAVEKTIELAYRNEIPPPSKREWRVIGGGYFFVD